MTETTEKYFVVVDLTGVYTFPKPFKANGPMEAKHAAIRKHVGSSMAYPYGIDEVVLERTISDLEATECEFTTNPLPDKTRKWLNSDQ